MALRMTIGKLLGSEQQTASEKRRQSPTCSSLSPVSSDRCQSFPWAEERAMEEKSCVVSFQAFFSPRGWKSPLKYSFLKCEEWDIFFSFWSRYIILTSLIDEDSDAQRHHLSHQCHHLKFTWNQLLYKMLYGSDNGKCPEGEQKVLILLDREGFLCKRWN